MRPIDADTLLIEISNGRYCKYCEVGKVYGCGDCDLYSFRDDNIEKLIDAQPTVNAATMMDGSSCDERVKEVIRAIEAEKTLKRDFGYGDCSDAYNAGCDDGLDIAIKIIKEKFNIKEDDDAGR